MAFTPALGTVLQHGVSGVFTTVAQLGDIDVADFKNDTEDVTSHNDADRSKRYATTLLDNGNVKVKVWWDAIDTTLATGSSALLTLQQAGTVETWKIIMPMFSPSASFAFSAIVEQFSLKAPVKGLFTADVTLKISGPVTFVS